MSFADYITVFNNILKNFSYLKSDFIGVKFNGDEFLHFIINIFLAALFILTYYLVGRKIRLLFFKNTTYNNLNGFIDIALGYIFVNSGLAVLGVFSLLYATILWIYMIVVLFIAFWPYYALGNVKNTLSEVFNKIKSRAKNNKWVFFGVLLFIIIAFFRLVPPEIGEDAIGYHTSDPHLFLKNHTMMFPSKSYPALVTPHLGEMSYMLSEFVGFKDSTRYIHFAFYFLVVFVLILINPYGALLFVTAPVVIQISSKANVDFQWILCWLLSILLITKNKLRGRRDPILIGVLFGGVLASKLWTIAFFPLFILYLLILHRKLDFSRKLNIVFIFSLFTFLIDVVWLWRSYIISGSPVYPAFPTSAINFIGFNSLMFHIKNVSVFSPLFFLGLIAILVNWRYGLKMLRKFNLFFFFVLLTTEYLFIKYHFGRYLLGLYSLAVLIVPLSISYVIKKYKLYKIIFVSGFGVMFIYYFINTLLVLPYGFGWADKNKYLTRVLARDNSSYYDFDKKFDRWISKKDKVATYETFGFYYADFDYIDINYIFDKDNKSFEQLRKYGITKLFIKRGTVESFCESLKISDCYKTNYKLLAQYPSDSKYLYEITRKLVK